MPKGKLSERLQRRLRRKPSTTTDSTFGRLRQIRNDHGNAALIGVLIALAITGIMLTVAGPDMIELIADTREAKLEQNFSAAVSIVENRLRADPESMKQSGDTYTSDGYLEDPLADDLFRDGSDFTWEKSWDLESDAGDNSDTTIYLQFITDGTDALPAVNNGSAPAVPWLLSTGTAVRVQAANEDGRWVCALIVMRSNVETVTAGTYVNNAASTGYQVLDSSDTNILTATSHRKAVMDATLTKVWYDSGDSYTHSTTDQSPGANSQLHNCSPVGTLLAAAIGPETTSFLPNSTQEWRIRRDTNGATSGGEETVILTTSI